MRRSVTGMSIWDCQKVAIWILPKVLPIQVTLGWPSLNRRWAIMSGWITSHSLSSDFLHVLEWGTKVLEAYQVITMSLKPCLPSVKGFRWPKRRCYVHFLPLQMMGKCWSRSLLVLFTIKNQTQPANQKRKLSENQFQNRQHNRPEITWLQLEQIQSLEPYTAMGQLFRFLVKMLR